MTQKELAAALGISEAMVSKLAKRGMPTDSIDRALRWRRRHLKTGMMKGVRRDTLDDASSPAGASLPSAPAPGDELDPEEAGLAEFKNARARKEHFEAELAKMKLQRECGELMSSKEVVAVVASAGSILRNGLESLPAMIAVRVAPISDENEVRAIMAEEIERALDNLSHELGKLHRENDGALG